MWGDVVDSHAMSGSETRRNRDSFIKKMGFTDDQLRSMFTHWYIESKMAKMQSPVSPEEIREADTTWAQCAYQESNPNVIKPLPRTKLPSKTDTATSSMVDVNTLKLHTDKILAEIEVVKELMYKPLWDKLEEFVKQAVDKIILENVPTISQYIVDGLQNVNPELFQKLSSKGETPTPIETQKLERQGKPKHPEANQAERINYKTKQRNSDCYTTCSCCECCYSNWESGSITSYITTEYSDEPSENELREIREREEKQEQIFQLFLNSIAKQNNSSTNLDNLEINYSDGSYVTEFDKSHNSWKPTSSKQNRTQKSMAKADIKKNRKPKKYHKKEQIRKHQDDATENGITDIETDSLSSPRYRGPSKNRHRYLTQVSTRVKKNPKEEAYYQRKIDELNPDLAYAIRLLLDINSSLTSKKVYDTATAKTADKFAKLLQCIIKKFPMGKDTSNKLNRWIQTMKKYNEEKLLQQQPNVAQPPPPKQSCTYLAESSSACVARHRDIRKQYLERRKSATGLEPYQNTTKDESSRKDPTELYADQHLVPPHKQRLEILDDNAPTIIWRPTKKERVVPKDAKGHNSAFWAQN